jgi:hypothetical protein
VRGSHNYGSEDIDDRIDDAYAIYNRDLHYVKIWEFDAEDLNSSNENASAMIAELTSPYLEDEEYS